jgi:secondary thiamine-phosphate synthase enzyme
MPHLIHHLSISTRGQGLVEVTRPIVEWVRRQGVAAGLLTVYCRHTSCSLLIQENADPDVRTDLEAFFSKLAPQGRSLYVHDTEGPDDMPAHIRTALTQTHLAIPVEGGAPLLGQWQAIYLFEHRAAPHSRELVLHLTGERQSPGQLGQC